MSKGNTERLRMEDRTQWVFGMNPEKAIQRTSGPNVLEDAEAAASWIRKKKPLLWTGSILSVPHPSGLPSGSALTESIINLLLPDKYKGGIRQELIRMFQRRWPLESILDLFEFAGFDLSESLLSFFEVINEQAAPNDLHRAVAKYYCSGLASAPLVFTVNWDTLQERAFRELGYDVLVAGPGQIPEERFYSPGENSVAVFHPHGSFQARDVICSFRQESGQLEISPRLWNEYPIAFLGYSGYEPSIYDHLHVDQAQLWCVRHLEDDMKIPAKRRILCRPNVFVYEGDLRELLKSIGLLSTEVDLESNYLSLNSGIPSKVFELLSLVLASSIEPNTCLMALSWALSSSKTEPEATIDYCMIMRCLISHIRDRVTHPGILPALIAASTYRETEQLWISALAYVLRSQESSDASISHFLDRAQDAAEKSSGSFNPIDSAIFGRITSPFRSKIYREFVEGTAESLNAANYILAPFLERDLSAVGEFAELLAFEYLREGNREHARNVFDYAATRFYLSGNWNAGRLNEWASSNIDRLAGSWDRHSLRIR